VRDNHQGTPEILAAYERDGLCFSVVRVEAGGEDAAFEFDVERKGYATLKRVLECRAFGSMPSIKHSFYFTGSYSRKKLDEEPVTIEIRITGGMNGRNFSFDCPTSLASNLRWFFQMKDLREASSLTRVTV
jgi:hypothetical protein